MELLCPAHPIKVQEFLTNYCIVVEDLIKFSEFEEKDLVKVMLLNLPILTHGGCKILPLFVRDV